MCYFSESDCKTLVSKDCKSVMTPAVDCFLWELIFQYLGPQELISVSSVCFAWWELVFGSRGLWNRKIQRCTGLDLSNTGTLYQKVPLTIFTTLRRLDLTGTTISTRDFLKITGTAKRLKVLEIESCSQIAETAIFKTKDSLRRLRCINISNNPQFGVLSIACLCSYRSIQEVCARGIRLDQTEMLFLTKTFPQLVNGGLELQTDTADGDYFFDTVDAFADEDIFEDFF